MVVTQAMVTHNAISRSKIVLDQLAELGFGNARLQLENEGSPEDTVCLQFKGLWQRWFLVVGGLLAEMRKEGYS